MGTPYPVPILPEVIIRADALVNGWRCRAKSAVHGNRRQPRAVLVLKADCSQIRQRLMDRVALIINEFGERAASGRDQRRSPGANVVSGRALGVLGGWRRRIARNALRWTGG